MALAATAAQALAESFDAWMDCGEQGCAVFRAGGSPGALIMAFAELLWKDHIEPGQLGLRHTSLRSRWLLLELDALLGGRKDSREGK